MQKTPHKSTALPAALRQATRLSLVSDNFNLRQYETINFKMTLKVIGLISGPRKRTGGVHRYNMEKQISFSLFFMLFEAVIFITTAFSKCFLRKALCVFTLSMPGFYRCITSIVVSHLTTLIF